MIAAHKKQNVRHGDKHLKQTHTLKLFSWFFFCFNLLQCQKWPGISCKTWMLNKYNDINILIAKKYAFINFVMFLTEVHVRFNFIWNLGGPRRRIFTT